MQALKKLGVILLLLGASAQAWADPCPPHFVAELQRQKVISGDVNQALTGKAPSPGTFATLGAVDALAGNVAQAKPNLLLGLLMPKSGSLSDSDLLLLRIPDYAAPDDVVDVEQARVDVLEALRVALRGQRVERTRERSWDKAVLRGGLCDGCELHLTFLLDHSARPQGYATGRVLLTSIFVGRNGQSALDPVIHDAWYLLEDLGYGIGYWRGRTKQLLVDGRACH